MPLSVDTAHKSDIVKVKHFTVTKVENKLDVPLSQLKRKWSEDPEEEAPDKKDQFIVKTKATSKEMNRESRWPGGAKRERASDWAEDGVGLQESAWEKAEEQEQ